jgi:hypothetical protein
MFNVLVDYHMEGQAELIWGMLAAEGWVQLLELRLVRFRDLGLDIRSNDREIWRFVQRNRMLLLTNNRNMEEADSLEQTLRTENTPTSLPILTIGNLNRINERSYRARCAANILDVVVDMDKHLGRGRIYIPW